MEKELVDHPDHYNSHPSGVEAIEVVRYMDFNTGNAVKYLWRLGHKDKEIQELRKVRWYLIDELERYKKMGFFSRLARILFKCFSLNNKKNIDVMCRDMQDQRVARAISTYLSQNSPLVGLS